MQRLATIAPPQVHEIWALTAGFTPEPSPFEQMSQEELNAQAKTLLSAAGYGPQKPLKLTLLYNTSENHQKIAIAVTKNTQCFHAAQAIEEMPT